MGANVKSSRCMTDMLAMACTVVAIVTGFMLHREVHHIYVYDDVALWGWHEAIGLTLMALIAIHGVQHAHWFKNYGKIPRQRKRVNTLFLATAAVVLTTGLPLMLGSRSELVSHVHYGGGILFTIIAIGHVFKRWKMFLSIIRK